MNTVDELRRKNGNYVKVAKEGKGENKNKNKNKARNTNIGDSHHRRAESLPVIQSDEIANSNKFGAPHVASFPRARLPEGQL